jgi:hypothetical protein
MESDFDEKYNHFISKSKKNNAYTWNPQLLPMLIPLSTWIQSRMKHGTRHYFGQDYRYLHREPLLNTHA